MENPKKLRIGAFKVAACESIENNLAAIKRGIARAADENVRLLLTQECAVCGYPSIEVPCSIVEGVSHLPFNSSVKGGKQSQQNSRTDSKR